MHVVANHFVAEGLESRTLFAGDNPFATTNLTPAAAPQTASISGYSFDDRNADGNFDPGTDVKTSGKTIFLDANNNGVLDSGELSTKSDSSGNWSFMNLPGGTYHVRRVFPAGYTYSNTPVDIDLATGEVVSGVQIGSKPISGGGGGGGGSTGTLSGFTFNDNNTNGTFDAGDAKTSGKTVFLDTNGNGALDSGEKSTTTNSSGAFTFSGLSAGTYHLRRVFPTGFTYSTAPIDVTLASGQTISNLAIGSKPGSGGGGGGGGGSTGSISGFTFNDNNTNGKFDAGDVKTSGKTVFLDTNNNGKIDSGDRSLVTDSNGNFDFTGLVAGTYHVRRIFPAGYGYSTALIDVVLGSGQNVSGEAIGSKAV